MTSLKERPVAKRSKSSTADGWSLCNKPKIIKEMEQIPTPQKDWLVGKALNKGPKIVQRGIGCQKPEDWFPWFPERNAWRRWVAKTKSEMADGLRSPCSLQKSGHVLLPLQDAKGCGKQWGRWAPGILSASKVQDVGQQMPAWAASVVGSKYRSPALNCTETSRIAVESSRHA